MHKLEEADARIEARTFCSDHPLGRHMMRGCERMMSGRSMGGGMMLQLPPGNEKLQFQMQAEMARKMGEIAAKYAERIK